MEDEVNWGGRETLQDEISPEETENTDEGEASSEGGEINYFDLYREEVRKLAEADTVEDIRNIRRSLEEILFTIKNSK